LQQLSWTIGQLFIFIDLSLSICLLSLCGSHCALISFFLSGENFTSKSFALNIYTLSLLEFVSQGQDSSKVKGFAATDFQQRAWKAMMTGQLI
jgi:hypothetical protein